MSLDVKVGDILYHKEYKAYYLVCTNASSNLWDDHITPEFGLVRLTMDDAKKVPEICRLKYATNERNTNWVAKDSLLKLFVPTGVNLRDVLKNIDTHFKE